MEALRRAMLPHLAKLDVILLQKAIRAAKEDGSVDEKLIKTAEGKLSQAQRRATTSDEQQAGKRDAALETLQAAMKNLQATIEETEAHHVDANKTSEAWAKTGMLATSLREALSLWQQVGNRDAALKPCRPQ